MNRRTCLHGAYLLGGKTISKQLSSLLSCSKCFSEYCVESRLEWVGGMQVRVNRSLGWGSSSGGREKWLGSECILKL